MESPPPIPRGSRPDAETDRAVYLVKNVPFLRATYQVRLLALKAGGSGKKLVLKVPSRCRFGPDLAGLIQALPNLIVREDLP